MRDVKDSLKTNFWYILFVVGLLIGLVARGCTDADGGEALQTHGTVESGATEQTTTTPTTTTAASNTERGPGIERTTEPGELSDLFPFYGNEERIEKTMLAIPGVKDDGTISTGAKSYTGGRFEGYPVRAWTFGFYGGQMTYGQVQLKTEDTGGDLQEIYKDLSNKMTERYRANVFSSDDGVSRRLDRYSDEEIAFIEKVGLSLKGGRFRIWTPTDSTADMLITIHMIAADAGFATGTIHLAWYDRVHAVAELRALGVMD